MNVYIASIWSRREEMRAVEQKLKDAGHQCTARWLWTTSPNTEEYWGSEALIDIEDLERSTAVLTFTQPHGSMNTGGGRHFELGYAEATGLHIIGVGPREIIFHHLPTMKFFDDVDAAIAYLGTL